MIRLRKILLVTGALAAIAFLAVASGQVRADNLLVDVYIQDSSGIHQVGSLTGYSGTNGVATSGLTTFSVTDSAGTTTFNDIDVIATSNSPATGSPTGTLAQTTISASSSSGPGKLIVEVFENLAYTSPGGPGQQLNLQSGVSDSDANAAKDALTFQSWVNTSTGGTLSGTTWGQQTFSIGGAQDQVNTAFADGPNGYWLSNELTLAAGASNINVSGTTTVATPAPANVLALLSAVPFLGLGAWLRRRKQVAIA